MAVLLWAQARHTGGEASPSHAGRRAAEARQAAQERRLLDLVPASSCSTSTVVDEGSGSAGMLPSLRTYLNYMYMYVYILLFKGIFQ